MKKTKQPTIYDIELEEKFLDHQDAYIRLKEATEAVIIKKNVIDLYPEGADKTAAIASFKLAQMELIRAIEHYDSTRVDIRDYYQEHNNFYKNWSVLRSLKTSHAIIEEIYERFFKK
jgi:hypothetical protein